MDMASRFGRAALAVAAVLAAGTPAWGKTETVGGVTWSYNVANKAATVTGANPAIGALEIPSKLGGYAVKAIGEDAFAYNGELTSVAIPEGVTSIGDGAFFYCTALESAPLPNSLKSIGVVSFSNCEQLKGLVLPGNLTSIGNRAFSGCLELAAVSIPASVTGIGSYPFSECPALASIDVASGNSKYTSVEGVLYTKSKDKLVACPTAKAGTVNIPGTVKSIEEGAFYYCTNVTAVAIPDSVSSFGESAFEGCGLTSAVLPKGLTTIASRLFCRCSNLESVSIPDSVTTISPWAFNSCESLQSLTLPKKLKSMGHKVFEWCLSLPELTIPDSVTSVGDWTFNWCTNLSSLTIGKGLTKIEAGLFYECSGLTEVTIPDNVKTIGESAFERCTGLVRLSIGSGVTGIGAGAFSGCGALSEITVASGNASFAVDGGVLFSKSKDTLVLYPRNRAGAAEIPGTVKTIAAGAFNGCVELTSATVPDSVKNIGEGAFGDCEKLSLVRLGAGVTNIGPLAFSYAALGVLTIPGSVKAIGWGALDCYGLKTVLAPASWEGTDKLDEAGLPEECRVVYGKVPEDGETATTGHPVPYAWLKEKGLGVDGTLEGFEEGAWSKAANGRPAWECYVAGLDLEDPEDDLLAVLSKEDGVWRVRPKGGGKPGRTYRVMGAAEMEDYEYWRDVTDEESLEYGPWRFFRIEAELSGTGQSGE